MSEPLLEGEFRVSSTPWHTDKGEIEKAVHVARDFTEQKQLAALLQQQAHQFLSVLEHLGTPASIVDPETYEILFINRNKADLLGRDVVGVKCFEAFQGRTEPCPDCNNELVLKLNGAVHRWEGYNQKLGRHFLHLDRIIAWPDGRRVKLEVAFDTTTEKEALERLRESEELYRQITEHSLTGIVILQDGAAVYVNQRIADILGYAVDEMMGKQILDAVHPEDRAAILSRFAARSQGDTSAFEYEIRLQRKTGETIWCQLLTTAIPYLGRPAIMANILDISDRKQYRERLEASRESYKRLFNQARDQEELYRSLLNCAPDPIVVYDMEGKVKYLNPAHTRLFGWTLEEAEGKRLNTLPEWDRERALSVIRQVVYDGAVNTTHETQRLTKDGRVVDVSISAGRYLDHQGNPAGMVVVLRDISDEKRWRRRSVRARRGIGSCLR